ncbi:MAG TPA: efflux transporter outer membrane subunit [Lacunisphaera sp.]|jgi:NodT family efflux transporter outer membrane factor (OMF) lipoprotein
MKSESTLSFILGGLLLLSAGCTVGPHYKAPKTPVAPAYSDLPGKSTEAKASRVVPGVEAVTRWWLIFGDDELNSLIVRAKKGNINLQLAALRVREARDQEAIIAPGLWPQIEATAGYDRGHGSKNVILPIGGASGAPGSAMQQSTTTRSSETADDSSAQPAAAGGAGGGGGAGAASSPFGGGGFPGVTTTLYQVGFDASWELDLFGGTRRAIEGANAVADATAEAQRGALVSLLGEVAGDYVQLRAIQQRTRIARENLAAQRDTLKIVQAKFKNGLGTEMDVARENAEVLSTEATLPALTAAERAMIHALAYLVDETPDALTPELVPQSGLPPLPAEVPVGVPSDLLRRRPDIRRAERLMAAATAQIGVAEADWWPRFSLTGTAGFDSSELKHLGDWDSHYYLIAPGIRWSILDWGRIKANIRIENTRQQQAFLVYRNTISSALRDVEDALVNYEQEQARRTSLAGAVDANRRARQLARESYDHGVTDSLTTLDAERSLLQSEDALAQSDGAMRRDLIALYKALGGGWE